MSDPRVDAWQALKRHPEVTLNALFELDPQRVEKLSGRIEAGEGGILLDWSKTHLTDELLEGFEAHPTPEGVSRATTRTVVVASLSVLGLDFILTAMMFSV